jgi:hypothetical protein
MSIATRKKFLQNNRFRWRVDFGSIFYFHSGGGLRGAYMYEAIFIARARV